MPRYVEFIETVDSDGLPLFLGKTPDSYFKRGSGDYVADLGDVYVVACRVAHWLLCPDYHNGFCGRVRADSVANRIADVMKGSPSMPWCSKPTPTE